MQKIPVLVLHTQDDVNELKMEYLSEDTDKKTLNGESIHHICHVSTLTGYLLQEMRILKPEYGLTQEAIDAISVAATLHDIGKLQIPQSVLDYPGTLTPLQFDIVKKHTIFGEKMILEAKVEDVDPQILSYAAQIAKYHHERIDGTGYPEGLRGAQIPLCAQVVAMADSFDALTSPRSYKEALSQDVALQMIANGMCGRFDEVLIDCLTRVINHRTLLTFGKNMTEKGSVVTDSAALHINRVLLIGNTEYVTKEFVDRTFPGAKVTVVGNTSLGGADTIKLLRVRKPSVKSILETYEFDLIVFFSAGLRFQSTDPSDAEELREVLQYSHRLQKQVKILYLSPLDSILKDKTDKAIMASTNEKLCEFYHTQYMLDVKTVQIPYLYSGLYQKDFLHEIFERMYAKKSVRIRASAMSSMLFLSLSDLSTLLTRIIDNWTEGSGVLSVGDEFHLTFSDLADKLADLDESATIEFREATNVGALKISNTALRSEYGWFAKVSLLEDLPEQYERYLESKRSNAPTIFDRIKNWISAHSMLVKTLELFLLFLITEYFIHLTGSAVIFSIVDFRTIFIVITATLYGLSFGIASATLSSISYFISRSLSGTDPMTMFYEPTNWLAFVFFYLVGALCGYANLKREDRCKYLEEQAALFEDKLAFTNEIYEDTLEDKKELKKQIISSKDSFGKIFDITRKLNTVAPHQLYLKIIEIFEEILENKNITVYSLKSTTPYARLEVASRDMLETASRSIFLETYAPVVEQLQKGEIWKNTSLNEEMPMYAAGVYRGNDLVLMIFLWDASISQKSLYYTNLFKILRDLVQMALLRAHDYNKALREKQYVADTHILNAEYFEECVKNFYALAEKKVSSFLLLEFDLNGYTLQEADAMLFKKVRTTDILGITADGRLRLILAQATEKDLIFILPRFEGVNMPFTVLK